MPSCPICFFPPGNDHRRCYFLGIQEGLWTSSQEWVAACERNAQPKKPAAAPPAVAPAAATPSSASVAAPAAAAPAAASASATGKKCSMCRQPGHTKRTCKGAAAGGGAAAAPEPEPEPELTWEKVSCSTRKVTLPAGRYYVSDLCYALPDPIYDEIWGKEFNYNPGVYRRSDGAMFVVDHTAYGDGCYRGSNNESYGVDAGVLAITSAALTDKPYGGTWHELKKPGTFSAEDGVFELDGDDYVRIDTSGNDEEEEDEENY